MIRKWTRKMYATLRREYPEADLRELAAQLGVTVGAVKKKAYHMRLRRKIGRHEPWSEEDKATLTRLYPDTSNSELAKMLGRTICGVNTMANILGLRKTPEYLSETGRRSCEHPNQVATRFKSGHISHNKGRRVDEWMSQEARERWKNTWFHDGHTPHNAKPVGYERTDKEGYILIKVAEHRRMVFKHRWIWEQANGPIPDGMMLKFKDGDKSNCILDNLVLMTRAQHMVGITSSMSPEHIKARTAKQTATRKETIRKDKLRIHWGLKPKTKLVKRW